MFQSLESKVVSASSSLKVSNLCFMISITIICSCLLVIFL